MVQALDQGARPQAQRERIGLHLQADGLVVIGGDRLGIPGQAQRVDRLDIVGRRKKGLEQVLAEEVQNVREFGPQMQPRSVETYLSGRMEMFTTQLDVTTEFQRVGAIKGLIVDRDGNTIYDLFSEFGVTAVTPSTSPWATPIPPSARSAASWCGRCRRPWAASPSPASMASAAMRSGTT